MAQVKDVYNILSRYENSKKDFYNATSFKQEGKKVKINEANLKKAKEWLKHKEERLKLENGRDEVASIRNAKTLYKEILMLKNVLLWFNDYDLEKLTKEEIKKVCVDIEDNIIKSRTGKKLSDSVKKDYYTKMFRGDNTFFGYLEKNILARRVIIRKFTEKQEVRFFDKPTFETIVKHSILPSHKLAFWLLFDTGIEVSALCQLTKSDFVKQHGEKMDYYKIIVPKEIAKKKRQKRYIDTALQGTKELLDIHLEELEDNERILKLNPPALYRGLKIIVKKHKLKTKGDTAKEITIKDFRSSCVMEMLNLGYQPHQVKGRLGHSISSRELDSYVNYLELNQKKEREVIQSNTFEELKEEVQKFSNIIRKQDTEIQELRQIWKELSEHYINEEMENQFIIDIIRSEKDEDLPPRLLKIKKASMTFLPKGTIDTSKPLKKFPLYEDK